MFRDRDITPFNGVLSTGDSVPLTQVPHVQLAQTLCCLLAFIQREQAKAARVLSIVRAFRADGAFTGGAKTPRFTADPRIKGRYDPECFNADVDDGSLMFVSDMSTDQLMKCVMRAFIVCEHFSEQDDSFKWWNQRPAVTVGPRLKEFIARSKTLPPLGEMECRGFYSRIRSLDSSIKARLVQAMGIYDDVPDFACSQQALNNIPLSVDGVSIKAAMADFLDQIDIVNPGSLSMRAPT